MTPPMRLLRDKPFLGSFLLVLLLASLSLAFFRPYFTFNDDYQILLLLKGVGMSQTPGEMVLFVNVLLCRFLKNLYIYFPNFQWYSAFQVLALFLSFWAILASVQMRPGGSFRATLFILSSFALVFYFFSKMQYTYTASLAAIGAFFLLAGHWEGGNPGNRAKVFTLAFVLLLVSALLRFSAFSLVVAASIPSVVFLAWKGRTAEERRPVLGFLTAVILLVSAASLYDYHVYHREAAWADFTRFERLRNQLNDFQNLVYDEKTKPVFDSIGWTWNDFVLFKNFCYLDKDIYSLEKLRTLADYFPKCGFNKTEESSFGKIFSHPTVQITSAFFLALLCFLSSAAWRLALINALWALAILLALALFFKTPERVCLPLVLFMMYQNLFFNEPLEQTPDASSSRLVFRAGLVLTALVFLFSLFFIRAEYQNNRTQTANTHVLKTSLQNFRPQNDQLYVNILSAFPFETIPAFDDFEMFRHLNLVQMAWFQRSPTTEDLLKRFGVTCLFRDMVDNPDLFLVVYSDQVQRDVANYLTMHHTYLKEKFGIDSKFEQVFACPFFWVLRVHSSAYAGQSGFPASPDR
jgi:hypothetical protein